MVSTLEPPISEKQVSNLAFKCNQLVPLHAGARDGGRRHRRGGTAQVERGCMQLTHSLKGSAWFQPLSGLYKLNAVVPAVAWETRLVSTLEPMQ
jgi:hypothetical protein